MCPDAYREALTRALSSKDSSAPTPTPSPTPGKVGRSGGAAVLQPLVSEEERGPAEDQGPAR
jgi:hypothetical protein